MMNGRLNGISAFPETFFVDKEGNIVGETYSGSHTLDEWKEIVEKNSRTFLNNKSRFWQKDKKNDEKNNRFKVDRSCAGNLGILLMIFGIYRGEVDVVFTKRQSISVWSVLELDKKK